MSETAAPAALPAPPYRPPAEGPLPLIYSDDALLVLDKPAGLLSVPGRGADKADCLVSRVHKFFPDALTVHRLDMETSGLILLARGADMQRSLSALFEARQVDKRYVAVVGGVLAEDAGEIDLPLITDWPRRPRQMVCAINGKPSQTRYRVIGRSPEQTRVALEPVTGRSHQLRVHMLAIGHPILGDALYAPPAWRDAAPRLLLHAESLRFVHPRTQLMCSFCAPLPF